MNENENATYQNSWDAAKGRFRQKIVLLNTYQEKLQNDLRFQFGKLDKAN